jgi:hypothetical protein
MDTPVLITAAMKNYADATDVCGTFSRINPTTPLRNNPYVKPLDRLHRAATGSVRRLMICPGGAGRWCGFVTPEIVDEDGTFYTACCGSATVVFNR